MGDCCSASTIEDPGQILRGNFPLQTVSGEAQENHLRVLVRDGVPVEIVSGDGHRKEKRLFVDKERGNLWTESRTDSKLTAKSLNPLLKNKRKQVISLADVVEVREPSCAELVPNAELFVRMEKDTQEKLRGRCCAVIYRGKSTATGRHFRSLCMCFVGETPQKAQEARDATAQVLGALATRTREEYIINPHENRTRELWVQADYNRDGQLSRREVSELLQQLNIQLSRKVLKDKFAAADVDISGFLDYSEFRWFFSQLSRRREIQPIYRKFAGGPRPGGRLEEPPVEFQEVYLLPGWAGMEAAGGTPPPTVMMEDDTFRRGLACIEKVGAKRGEKPYVIRWVSAITLRASGPQVEVPRDWWDGSDALDEQCDSPAGLPGTLRHHERRKSRVAVMGKAHVVGVEWPIQVINGRGDEGLPEGSHWQGAYSLHRGGHGGYPSTGNHPGAERGERAWVRQDEQAFIFRGEDGDWGIAKKLGEDRAERLLLWSSCLQRQVDALTPAQAGPWLRIQADSGAAIEDYCVTVDDAINANGFQEFLQQCQNDKVDLETAQETIAHITGTRSGLLSQQMFTSFLLNTAQNGWFKPHHRVRVYQPMDQPLNDYFVNSSHNTYLTGDQLKSRSATEMYKITLEKGCRCVELDCWDGPGGEPIIYHGHTRTTKIGFKQVCEVINQFAFTTSEYPIVLSLEVHTSAPQQKAMAHHMRTIFAERLYPMPLEYHRAPGPPVDAEDTERGPKLMFTPKGLTNRILVKAKMNQKHYKGPLAVSPALAALPAPEGAPYGGDAEDASHRSPSILQPAGARHHSAGSDGVARRAGTEVARTRTGKSPKTGEREYRSATSSTLRGSKAALTDGVASPPRRRKDGTGSPKQKSQEKADGAVAEAGAEDNAAADDEVSAESTEQSSDEGDEDEEGEGMEGKPSKQGSFLLARKLGGKPNQKPQPRKDDHAHEKTTLELSSTVAVRGRHFKPSPGSKVETADEIKKRGSCLRHEICSYSEGAFNKYINNKESEFIEATKQMCFRAYPSGARVWSDNYSPIPAWNVGMQFVALNYQTLDFPMRLNEAKFEANGGCGYLLKPEVLRKEGMNWNDIKASFKLRVKVISGSQIPKTNLSESGGIVDPYVSLIISGLKEDSTREPLKTRVFPSNGFDPLWNEDFLFRIKSVDMAILTLRVSDNNTTGIDYPIAEASIPLTSLRPGYRCVPLRNILDNVEIDNASLFCHFLITEEQAGETGEDDVS